MLYEVVIEKRTSPVVYETLSYEDVINHAIDHLISNDSSDFTIRRRCCSSMKETTMDATTANSIRKMITDDGDCSEKEKRRKMDIAVNNWYLRGKISLSDVDALRYQNIFCETEQ